MIKFIFGFICGGIAGVALTCLFTLLVTTKQRRQFQRKRATVDRMYAYGREYYL